MTDPVVLFHVRDYRGATVEDLDIKPAVSVNPVTDLSVALEIAFENEFTYLPVIHESNKKLLGVVNVERLRKDFAKYQSNKVQPIVKHYMIWFHQSAREKYEKEEHSQPIKASTGTTIMKPNTKGKKYQVITPWTPLEKLAKFFNGGIYFAIITNEESNFVYGVATPEDLIRYENSRPRL